MLDRLLGQETEYAIRVSAHGTARPGRLTVYRAIAAAVRGMVKTQTGRGSSGLEPIFLENGGAISYEFTPSDIAQGLVEGATPECRGPGELVLYQQAQERLLERAARKAVVDHRWPGELALIKNCRDAYGQIYGAQENYQLPVASGLWLTLYRVLLIAA
ncbi:MAG: proteasome accessory factor PafA2 family protein, partial [Myxococcota bacterium]